MTLAQALTPQAGPLKQRDPVRDLLLAYLLAWLLEGVMRKWLLSPLQEPLYFIRVPIVLAAVGLAMRRMPARLPGPALAGMLGIIGIACFSCIHIMMADQTPIQALLGSRLAIELFLMPLALGPWLRPRHALSAFRLLVAMVLPITILAVAQVVSSPGSPLNKIFEDGGEDNFTNVGGIVRATGVFTSSSGHVGFVVLAVAATLALALSEDKTTSDRLILPIALTALPVLILTSGSRSAIFGTGFVLIISIPIIALYRPSLLPRITIISIIVAAGAWKIVPILAPDAIYSLLLRLLGAGMNNEASGRALGGLTSWVDIIPLAPSFGLGLGATAQGLRALNNSNVRTEAELEQWVMQLGPALFFLALLFRVAAIGYLLRMSISAVLRGRMAAAPIVAAGLWAWLVGTTTNQGSVNGYAVICALLVLCYRQSIRANGDRNQVIDARESGTSVAK